MNFEKVTKVTPDGKWGIVESAIISEFSIILYVNNKEWMNMVCTASDIKELAVGRMVAERLICSIDDIEDIVVNEEENRIDIRLTKDSNNISGEYKVLPEVSYEHAWIFQMIQSFSEEGKLHKKTKAAHSCILGRRGEVLFQCEDIGRHNAMDKAIGYMYLHKIKPEECMLFTSGRVPTEMAGKAIAAGIPILISKAVPTDRTLEMAKQYNLKLICKAWPDSFEIFN